ncbi:MAG: HAD-IIB family hydrolase, partial [Angustibacter sp.]
MSGTPAVVLFDLDDTLAESKSPMTREMATLLGQLLARVPVCIISGGRYEQFQEQVLAFLPAGDHLTDLHLMPTCGTQYYRWQSGDWRQQYAENLSEADKARVISALTAGSAELGLDYAEPWGPIIEDRGSQITFSALGQRAPVAQKVGWDPTGEKKAALRAYVAARVPDLEVRSGGSTSVDVTRQGVDKSFGVRKLAESLGLKIEDFLFIGDRLDEDGNDYPVLAMG